MASYTFDGKILRNPAGQKMGEIDRSNIRAWNSSRLGEIDRKNIRDSHGKKVAEFDGKQLKDDRGKRIIGVEELKAIIEGEPDISMAAMWYFFVKK